jgi:hypothetical protein
MIPRADSHFWSGAPSPSWRRSFSELPPIEEDPIWEMVGADPHAEPARVDGVVYGPALAE